jgi:AraC-like DNA-binding protein
MGSIIQAAYHSREMLSKMPHFHTCHQIILIEKGYVDFCVNGKVFHAAPGDLAIFSCYENHSVSVRSPQYERFVLQLAPSADHWECPAYSLLTDRPSGFSNVISILPCHKTILDIFSQLTDEYRGSRALADWMLRSLVTQLLILIFRCSGLECRHRQDTVVLDIKRQFEEHFNEKYTLSALAGKYCISVSALSHRFQATTGTSVMDYLLSCRIAHAKQLLANTDLPIGDIIEKCGFSDNSNFSRTFKRLNGISPTDFRKKYQSIS